MSSKHEQAITQFEEALERTFNAEVRKLHEKIGLVPAHFDITTDYSAYVDDEGNVEQYRSCKSCIQAKDFRTLQEIIDAGKQGIVNG